MRTYRRGLDRFRHYREVIQSFFDKQSDDSVRVEQKVASGSILVADDGVERLQLCRVTQGGN